MGAPGAIGAPSPVFFETLGCSLEKIKEHFGALVHHPKISMYFMFYFAISQDLIDLFFHFTEKNTTTDKSVLPDSKREFSQCDLSKVFEFP